MKLGWKGSRLSGKTEVMKRLLWLCTHRTQWREEVPLLLQAGFEVIPVSKSHQLYPFEEQPDDPYYVQTWRQHCTLPRKTVDRIRLPCHCVSLVKTHREVASLRTPILWARCRTRIIWERWRGHGFSFMKESPKSISIGAFGKRSEWAFRLSCWKRVTRHGPFVSSLARRPADRSSESSVT